MENKNNNAQGSIGTQEPNIEKAGVKLLDAASIIKSARLLIKDDKGNEAVELLKNASDSLPSNVPIRGLLAEQYSCRKEYSLAEEIWLKLLQADVTPFWIYVGYGNMLEKVGNLDKAIKIFLSALEVKYSSPLVYRLATLARRKNELDKLLCVIESNLKKAALPSDQIHDEFINLGAISYSNKDHKLAVEFFDYALKIDPTSCIGCRKKVKSQLKMNLISDANTSILRWKEKFPNSKRLDRFEKVIQLKTEIAPYIDLLKNLFMPEYYRNKYAKECLTNKEAFDDFINNGLTKKCNPNPWFSSEYFEENHGSYQNEDEMPLLAYLRLEASGLVKPTQNFDPVYYRANNPDLKDMPSMLEHYLTHGYKEGRLTIERKLPKVIVNEFDDMLNFESKLLSAKSGLSTIVRYPSVSPSIYVPSLVRKKHDCEIDAVVCVPFISRGGADLISTYVLRSLQEQYGIDRVLFIVTESVDLELKSWFSDKTKVVLLGQEATYTSMEGRALTLHNTIGQYNPKVIMNVNSLTCWEMLKNYGRQLSSVTSIYAYLFCYDYNRDRNRVGYITDYLLETLSYLDGVAVDNQALIDDLLNEYRFSAYNSSKFNVAYTPYINSDLAYDPECTGEDVLWIGRLSDQKRPDLLIDIAQRMPALNFHVYGPPGNSDVSDLIVEDSIRNISYKGTYKDLSEIEYDRYQLFLHTSEWEGLPTVLIQMMGIGLPIVTSDVGGVGELVTTDTGIVIDEFESVESYTFGICKVLSDRDAALQRAANGRVLVRNRHTWEHYVSQLGQTGLFSLQQKKSLLDPVDEPLDLAQS